MCRFVIVIVIVCLFYLAQARVIFEEGISTEKMSQSDCPVDVSISILGLMNSVGGSSLLWIVLSSGRWSYAI